MSRWILISVLLSLVLLAVVMCSPSCRGSTGGNPTLSSTPDGEVVVTANLHGSGLHIAKGNAEAYTILEGTRIQWVELDSSGETSLVSAASEGSNYRIALVDHMKSSIENVSAPGDWNDFFPTRKDTSTVLFWRSTRRSGDLSGGSNPSGFEIFSADTVTKSVKQITNGDYFNVAPIVLVAGGSLAVFRAFNTVYQLDMDNGTVKEFIRTHVEITPVCRSDKPNRFIAIGNTTGHFDYDLYEVDAINGETVRLTTGLGYIESVAFASKSKELLVLVGHPRPSLRRIPLDSDGGTRR